MAKGQGAEFEVNLLPLAARLEPGLSWNVTCVKQLVCRR